MSLLVGTNQALYIDDQAFRKVAQDLLPWRKECFPLTENLMLKRFDAVKDMMMAAEFDWAMMARVHGWDDIHAPEGDLIMKWGSDEEVWPYKLREADFTLEEFVLRMSGGVKGIERLIEWNVIPKGRVLPKPPVMTDDS